MTEPKPDRGLTDTEIYELRRMLAAFKADLPQHELGYWFVTFHPHKTVLEDDPPPNVHRSGVFASIGEGTIRGHAECVRCRKRFDIESSAAWLKDIEKWIAEAKARVERDAERDGPCWGDVPKPDDHEWSGVTLDSLLEPITVAAPVDLVRIIRDKDVAAFPGR